jgi:hypothetical protein
MNMQIANLSTDMRRISNWIYEGKNNFVSEYMSKLKEKYRINKSVGVYEDIWQEIEIIKTSRDGRIKSADRATTLASILLQESLKS